MKEVKQKKCPICSMMFTPFSTTQRVDTPYCAIAFNKLKDAAKEKKADIVRKKCFYADDVSYQHKLTQPVFNKLRRMQELKWFKQREIEPTCISCDKPNMDWCCGHLKTVGSQGAIRYDEINTYLQCNRYCNKGLSGNIEGNKNTRGYKVGLVQRFGQSEADKIIEYCEVDRVRKWTGQELIEMRKDFNKQIREIKEEMHWFNLND